MAQRERDRCSTERQSSRKECEGICRFLLFFLSNHYITSSPYDNHVWKKVKSQLSTVIYGKSPISFNFKKCICQVNHFLQFNKYYRLMKHQRILDHLAYYYGWRYPTIRLKMCRLLCGFSAYMECR